MFLRREKQCPLVNFEYGQKNIGENYLIYTLFTLKMRVI